MKYGRSYVKRVPPEFAEEFDKFKETLGLKSDADTFREIAKCSRIGRTMTSLLYNNDRKNGKKKDDDFFGGL